MGKEDSQQATEIGFHYYVVALIDVLNQREHLATLATIPTSEPASLQFQQAVKRTVGTLEFLRNKFSDFVRTSMRGVVPPTSVLQTPELEAVVQKLNRVETPRFQHFSDTLVAFARLRNEDGYLTTQAIFSFLGACATMLRAALQLGVAIRGGIEVGLGTEALGREIYGAVLFDVYRLESLVAQYPRIVVGNELLNYLVRVAEDKNKNDIVSQFHTQIASKCQELVVGDLDDGVPIVDFLGKTYREISCLTPELEEDLRNDARAALEFAASEHERFKRNGDVKLAERYARLSRYLLLSCHEWLS